MRRQFLNSAKGRFVGLAAVGAAVVATQLASTGPAVASPAAEPTTITVHDTTIAAGTAGVVSFTTSSTAPWVVSVDLRNAGFWGTRDMITWDEPMCSFYLEFLTCTPTAGEFHIYFHVPADAPAGGTVLVRARYAGVPDTGAYDTGVVTVGAPES